jgi:lactate permease
VVEPAKAYAKFRPFSHPAPIILAASLASILLFSRNGSWKKGGMGRIASKTVRKCLNTTYTLLCFIPMAIVMMDAGMMKELSAAVAGLTGKFFPMVSPMIGALGSFITGSNTTSNVIFGKFQQMVAERLGITAAMICAAQSVGASVGCALGPTQVLLGITAAGLDNQAHRVYKKVLPLVIVTVILMGIPSLAFALLGKGL